MGRRERGRRPAMIVSSTGALNKFGEIIFFSAGGLEGWSVAASLQTLQSNPE